MRKQLVIGTPWFQEVEKWLNEHQTRHLLRVTIQEQSGASAILAQSQFICFYVRLSKESFHKLFTTVGAEAVLVPLLNTLHHIGEIFQAPFLTVRCRNLQ